MNEMRKLMEMVEGFGTRNIPEGSVARLSEEEVLQALERAGYQDKDLWDIEYLHMYDEDAAVYQFTYEDETGEEQQGELIVTMQPIAEFT